jgi:hypothetical protein
MNRFACRLTAVLACLGALRVDATPPSFDAMPDHRVAHWIRYENGGPRNQPIPTVYISTGIFKLGITDILIVVPPAKYEIVASFTRAQIARGDCLTEVHPRDGVPISIIEYDEGHVEQCVLPQTSSCKYLAGVVSLPRVDWAAGELKQITNFMGDSGCDTAIQSK